jgi:hypothetical protein
MVKLTSSVTGVQIKLAPLGVIEGKVVDQDGEPVRGVSVSAYIVNVFGGVRSMSIIRTAATNDQGHFRIWNLNPGKYYVKATGKSGGTYMYIGDASGHYDSTEAFVPIYFGGARDLESATPIVVGAGTEVRADFTLAFEPSFKIRGALQNFSPHEHVAFEIFQGDEDVSASRVTLNGTDGRFEIQDVTDGTYTLRATQLQKARGETTVTVKGGNIEGVSIALFPSIIVRGVVQVVGAQPKAENSESCTVMLFRPGSPNSMVMQQGKNGEFTIPNVFTGQYRVDIDCTGGYATSAQSGSIDLLSTPRITVEPGVAPAPIEINLKPGGGTVKGKLAIDPKPTQGGILLVPTFSASTGPTFMTVGNWLGAPDASNFELRYLAPGDYIVYAFSTARDVEYRNPAFLQSLTGGVPVHIDDAQTTEVTIMSVSK